MKVARIGLDIAKSVFQVHGVDVHGKAVLRKTLSRGEVLKYFAQCPPCVVGMEACAGAHLLGVKVQQKWPVRKIT